MEQLNICSIPVIAALCYGFIEAMKKFMGDNVDERISNAYPLISAGFGTMLGMVAYIIEPELVVTESFFGAALAGMASGLSATGGNQVFKQVKKMNEVEEDDSPARYYITGDKHRRFKGLINYCKKNKLRPKDVIIILGDSGFNFYGDERDETLKKKMQNLGVILFSIHGNKENRPQNISTYGYRNFCGGKVLYEPQYPNLLFAIDGEVYNFNGKEFMCIGGAHSVDRCKRIDEGLPYWDDEMPDCDTKTAIEAKLEARSNEIYGFLTHTCPISVLPTEMFMSVRKVADEGEEYEIEVDRSTEEWLEELHKKVKFTEWYCGHYHIDKEIDDVIMMHRKILPFCEIGDNKCF